MCRTIAVVLIFASFQSLDCTTGLSNSRLNYFDIDLLRYVAEGKSGNVMVSPASIKSTLAMLLDGARGDTATQIQTALRLYPKKYDYREQLSTFMKDLKADTSSVSVQNANGLFISKKLELKKEYEMIVERAYFAAVNKLDFSDPRTAMDIINGWVSGKTRGLIPSIIDQAHISPQTELLVTNALYFKGTWQHEFEPAHSDCFYREGNCKTVAMMDLEAKLNYAFVDDLRAHALELPYEGDRYSMILLVPIDRDAGLALIRDLPYIGLFEVSELMEPSDVVLTMPKFTVEYSEDMVATLQNMGIKTLFTPSANLSGIFKDSSAYLNNIFHKVYMSVDEKGTVAAAATAGMVVPLINNQVQLRVDRPFIFFIKDNEKGVVLFEGKIEEPTEFVEVNNKPDQKPIVTKPQPVLTPTTNQKNSISSTTSETTPVQPMVIQPIVSQPLDHVPTPITNKPTTTNQPASSPSPTEDPTTKLPKRKGETHWYQKISTYFG